jgi:acyl-CoA thioester hydrolase
MRVEPAWIDYNGHLNMAYYHVLFDGAVDEVFLALGLGPEYRRERGGSTFTAEIHTVYKREIGLDDPVRVTTQFVAHDDKRLHGYQEIRHAEEGWVSATCEFLTLHMDMASRRVAPFPADIRDRVARMGAAHATLPRPADLGRVIGVRRREASTSV